MEFAWWQKEVIYQILTRSFYDSTNNGIGDINGIRSHLDYLKDLGIGAISLSPFFATTFLDSGYDVINFYEIDDKVGSLDDFDLLVNDLHNLGLKLIIDMPVDFTSIKHPWFIESCSSKDNAKSDYYIWSDDIPNNWLSKYSGKAWSFNKERNQYYMHSFFKEEPDLNWRCESVINEFISIFKFWFDRGVDGINANAINLIVKDKNLRDNPKYPGFRKSYHSQRHIFDRNRPYSHRRAKRLRSICEEYVDEDKILLGEIIVEQPGEPELAASYYGGIQKDELNLVFDYTFVNIPFKPKTWVDAAQRWYDATDTSWPCWVLSNQFKPRIRSRFKGNIQQSRLAALFLLTQKGTPFIYYGEELGMEDSNVSRNKAVDIIGRTHLFSKKGRDGARSPMLWTLEKYSGFSKVTPYLPLSNKEDSCVEVQKNKKDSLYFSYKKFIELRKNNEALSMGDITIIDVHDDNLICYLRTSPDQALLVLLNFTKHKRKIKLADIGLPLQADNLIYSTNIDRKPTLDKYSIILSGFEGSIYSLDL